MRKVKHDPRRDEYDEPAIHEIRLRDLRYADDTAILASTTGIENQIKSVEEHSDHKGLK